VLVRLIWPHLRLDQIWNNNVLLDIRRSGYFSHTLLGISEGFWTCIPRAQRQITGLPSPVLNSEWPLLLILAHAYDNDLLLCRHTRRTEYRGV
jgi:hypothetical protein